jgi:hypothetical protein
MKTITTFNFFHSNFQDNLDRILDYTRRGEIKEDDIKLKTGDIDGILPISISTPADKAMMSAGYESYQYQEALEDYLRVMILCGFRTNEDLFSQVKADHEDEDGNLTVDAFYTNDPNEEGIVIATVLSDTTVEDRSGDPISTILKFGEKAEKAISDAIIRQQNRNERLVQAVHDDIIKQVNEGDTTVLEGLLQRTPHSALLHSLDEKECKKYGC